MDDVNTDALDRTLPGEYLLAPHQIEHLASWVEGWASCPWCDAEILRAEVHRANCLLAEICELSRESREEVGI